MQYFLAMGLAIAALAILFALQNPAAIAVRLLIWQIKIPLALLLLLVLALGATIGVLCLLPSLLRYLRVLKQQRQHLQELQRALAESDDIQANQNKRIRYLETHLQQQPSSDEV